MEEVRKVGLCHFRFCFDTQVFGVRLGNWSVFGLLLLYKLITEKFILCL
jgi:hypothetical protein